VSHFWKLFFVPHEKNNHKAFLLQPGFIGLFIAIYLLNQSLIKSLTILHPGVLGYSSEITAQKVFDQTNLQRQKAGLPALSYNQTLSQSATAKANDMFASNYWAHNSPSGKSPWDFFKAAGYAYSIAGENLAKDFYDTESMMRAWMNSPTHKANIVSQKYQEIGIGVVNGTLNGIKTTLVVQHFGTPQTGKVYTKTKVQTTTRLNPRVLSESDVANIVSQPMISPLQISQAVGTVMFVIIIGVLIVDAVVTLRNKTQRLSSSSLGHVGFLAIILMLLLFSRGGTIF
jgi:uncharacterized protein YkwD